MWCILSKYSIAMLRATGVSVIKSERKIVEFSNPFHWPKSQNMNSQHIIDCTIMCTCSLITWVQLRPGVCSYASMYRGCGCSGFCAQYRLSHSLSSLSECVLYILYLSPVSQLNNLSIPILFSLLTTHTLPFILRVLWELKQCFMKTIVMAFCQQWPQPSQPFGLIQCSLSHLEASPWRSYGHFLGHQWVQLKWSDCKNGLCAAICFAINNGWVTTLFKIIKLLDSSKMKTCAYTQKQWN